MRTAEQAMLLSSGTIASLTGFRKYEKIDMVQASFVRHCLDGRIKGPWQDAWAGFWGMNQ
jgi:hypothetical protein